MDRKLCALAGLVMLGMMSPAPASGATLVDTSPEALGVGAISTIAVNGRDSQNFVTSFSLSETTRLTGIDSYSSQFFGSLGDPATVRIFSDANGAPLDPVFALDTRISAYDGEGGAGIYRRRHAAFEHVLSAGTYWIGLSGADQFFTQLLIDDTALTRRTAIMVGTQLSQILPERNDYDQASIRLFGDVTAVPLPGGLALLLTALTLGCGGIAVVRKRSRQA